MVQDTDQGSRVADSRDVTRMRRRQMGRTSGTLGHPGGTTAAPKGGRAPTARSFPGGPGGACSVGFAHADYDARRARTVAALPRRGSASRTEPAGSGWGAAAGIGISGPLFAQA
jgi:hypothetical protein